MTDNVANIGQLVLLSGMPIVSVSDTISATDSVSYNQSVLVNDTVTTSDSVDVDPNRIHNTTKNSSTFTNTPKS